jgi:hypothetical protein
VALISWIPLAVLAVAHDLAFSDDTARSFFRDFGTHGRFLIAAPLLILAEAVCLPRLSSVARRFLETGVVSEADRPRFEAISASSRRLLQSLRAEIIIVVVAYAVSWGLLLLLPREHFPAWRQPLGLAAEGGSLPAWWLVLVSSPLLKVLIYAWLWRQFVWARFLWLVSRLDLRLVPPHPDGAGGMRFVESALKGYWPLSVAQGAILAGSTATQVARGESPVLIQYAVIAQVVVVLALFVTPFLMLSRSLKRAKSRGRAQYGLLSSRAGWQFQRKWFRSEESVDESVLEMPDFSATTDLYQVVSNINGMKNVPFSKKSLINLVLPGFVPFLPLALAYLPREEVVKALQHLAKLLA